MQRGTLQKSGKTWYVRYRRDGIHYAQSLGIFETKTSARVAADIFMQKVNALAGSPVSPVTTLGDFWETTYLPYITAAREPSTVKGYLQTWKVYLEPRVADMTLLEFQTYHGDKLMRKIASEYKLSHETLKHIKATLVSVFKQAKRMGAVTSNPMHDAEVPKGEHTTADTYAYSVSEILNFIRVLPDPASTIVAVAGLAGLRRSEIRGLYKSDYDGDSLHVSRKVWNSYEGELKTKASHGSVPVIAVLREKLEAWLRIAPDSFYLFPSATSASPLSLDNVRQRTILPTLQRQSTLTWHGWHAFRRGLGTNLKSLGVDDKIIQGILRHAQISTTQNIYMKAAGLKSSHVDALQKLNDNINLIQ